MVTTLDVYKEIRRLQLEGATSQRWVANTLGISRNTVKKYWDGDSVPWERKNYSRDASVMTGDVVVFIRKCLEEDEQCRSRKQHHTAKRIYDRPVDECGFTGGETTVKRLVRELREKMQKVFVPLAFPAGDAVQIDWGEATIYLQGNKTVVNLFSLDSVTAMPPLFWPTADKTKRAFWMYWYRFFSILAVFRER